MNTREPVAIGLGVVWASLAPATVYAVVFPPYKEPSLAGLLLYAIGSTAVTLLVGLPMFFLLRRFGPGVWWMSAGVGLVIGLLVDLIALQSKSVEGVLVAGFSGVIAALGFWLIWKSSVIARQGDSTRSRQ